jgi:DNA-binding MarR family transcriptional regulator
MKRESREIRIYPEEADLLVRMLKLRMKGYTDYKIAKKLSMTESSVKRRLDRIERDFLCVTKYVDIIRTAHYFARKRIIQLKSSDTYERGASAIERLLSQGVPLATGSACHARRLPGYKQVENRVEVDKKTLPLAKLLFETFYNGGNMAKLCREHNLHHENIRKSMDNPLYIGIIRHREKEYFFPKLATINREMWKACQPFPKPKRYVGAKAVYGFIRRAGRLYKDPEMAPNVEQVIELRLKMKGATDIMKETGLPRWIVRGILDKPEYAGKVLVDGKYVDAGEAIQDEIVPFEKWLKAHNALEEEAGRNMKIISAANRSDILAFLRKNKPRVFTSLEIAKEVSLTKGTVNRHLYKLEKNGLVEKITPENKPFARKWRSRI